MARAQKILRMIFNLDNIFSMKKFARHWHRKLGWMVMIPAIVIFSTGVLLQIKGKVAALQPPVAQASAAELRTDFPAILAAARSVPEAAIKDWNDVHAIDVRPKQAVVRVRNKAGYEVQIDGATGAVLAHGMRWTTVLIKLHDGSWFGDWAKWGAFLPTALGLCVLLVTGIWMQFQPYFNQRARRRKEEKS